MLLACLFPALPSSTSAPCHPDRDSSFKNVFLFGGKLAELGNRVNVGGGGLSASLRSKLEPTHSHPHSRDWGVTSGFHFTPAKMRILLPVHKGGKLSAVLVIRMTKQAAASSMCHSLHSRSPSPVLIFRLVNSSNCSGAFRGPSSWVSAVERVPLHPCRTKLPLLMLP